jgi:hypothetical protein
MVGDPCYLRYWKADNFLPAKNVSNPDKDGSYPYTYPGACSATLSQKKAGVLEHGIAVVTSAGYGDGTYPVFVEYEECKNCGTRVKRLVVEFISDKEEDDSEEEEA